MITKSITNFFSSQVRAICGRPKHAAAGTVGRAAAARAAAAVARPRALVRPQGDGEAGGGRCGKGLIKIGKKFSNIS